MHIISRKPIREFCKLHPIAESSLQRWFKIVSRARWTSFEDARKTFPSVDRVGEFLVFNICGNKYRLIAVLTNYCHLQSDGSLSNAKLLIKKICTHAEYSKIKIPDDLRSNSKK
ncbi:type II toxin-antitoxin system HigB family toxin [Limnothrix sp. FACHB-881]|uniref:type II toxin-antitoxin system HigB family toxin n=1 Tax=Limnothrix sp. FACHB-881 TaxID=2692819 RepID=UPI0016859684|nr:type II toxin-antitoxin system HigB family toxin [Limnothrix sp. FACHB-881]